MHDEKKVEEDEGSQSFWVPMVFGSHNEVSEDSEDENEYTDDGSSCSSYASYTEEEGDDAQSKGDDEQSEGDDAQSEGDDEQSEEDDSVAHALTRHPAMDLVAKLVSNDTSLVDLTIDAATVVAYGGKNHDTSSTNVEVAWNIAQALQSTSYLTKLTLQGSWRFVIANHGNHYSILDVLLPGIIHNTSIKDLVLDQNPQFDRHTAVRFGRAIAHNNRIKRLTISQCQFTDAVGTDVGHEDSHNSGSGLALLCMGLQHSKTLTGISLCHVDLGTTSKFGSDIVASCVSLLQLSHLCLSDTNLTRPSHLSFLLDQVQASSRLVHLDLSHNYLGPKGIEVVARCFAASQGNNGESIKDQPNNNSAFSAALGKPKPGLQSLALENCGLVQAVTIKTLARALTQISSTLTSLNLSQNAFGDKGARRLQDFLEHHNTAIVSLQLVGCGVSSPKLNDISNQLRYNNSFLKSMGFSNDITLGILDSVKAVESFSRDYGIGGGAGSTSGDR